MIFEALILSALVNSPITSLLNLSAYSPINSLVNSQTNSSLNSSITSQNKLSLSKNISKRVSKNTEVAEICQVKPATKFLVIGGGGAPSYNEIALEKNLLYFQRSLRALGYAPIIAKIFFANGNDGVATVRYVDSSGTDKYKPPSIPNLNGASTVENLTQEVLSEKSPKPLFFYFTGHGSLNRENPNDNSMILWNEQRVSVRQFAKILDQTTQSVVAVMSQCYSGSFANIIYQSGDSAQPIAKQSRCGFFATIKTQTSVGCTPEVDEADYRDYSSSFYAGLTGRSRTNKTISSADYNADGRVSYIEAHAFAKIDDISTDLPISTSEAWLQEQASVQNRYIILGKPMTRLLIAARPEQRYVVNSLLKMFEIKSARSFRNSQDFLTANPTKLKTNVQRAFLNRLRIELINIGMEQQIRNSKNTAKISILNRILKCESGSWQKP